MPDSSIASRKLRLSINPSLINKNEADDKLLFKKGWVNTRLTPSQLANQINRGVAYCCELSGSRNANNFVCSEVLSVDIDATRTIDDALSDPLVKEHLTILYTTPNHTEQRPRFRLVFALPKPIESAREMVAAYRSLALRLGGDRSATDAARLFYGSKGSNPTVYDRCLSEELLDDLILQGLEAGQRDVIAPGFTTTISKKQIDPDRAIRLATGEYAPFASLGVGAKVHCPFHFDENASAFVLANSAHTSRGIHCSTCAQTFWEVGANNVYDFDDFESRVAEAEEYFAANKDIGPFQTFLNKPYHHGLLNSNIIRQSSEFLELPNVLREGLFFIKSPKGSGKTEQIAKTLQEGGRSVLLIGHRIALIRQSCARLGLECYLDFPAGELARKSLGVCLDSLHRLQLREKLFHTIIIDESEQVLSHFLSDTIDAPSRDELFKRFELLLKHAKRVVALDADLSWLTFETISKLAQSDDVSNKRSTIYLNEFPSKSTLEVFASKDHLIGDMKQSLLAGLRVFVTSNSKALMKSLYEGIENDFGDTKKAILVTSDTTAKEEVKTFIQAPSHFARRYDVMLTSPSLGTGIDITFEDKKQLVDVVYGFFEANITTHFDCDQQLRRVRHPGAVKVWLSPRRFSFDTARDVVKQDIQQKNLYKSVLSHFDTNHAPVYHTDDPLIDMAALARSQQLASKNNLKLNFLRLKKRQGHIIEYVESNSIFSTAGSKLRVEGKGIADEKWVAALLGAETLTRSNFEEIEARAESNEVVSEQEKVRLARTRIEQFYREKISRSLIDQDNRGRTRSSLVRFEQLMAYADENLRKAQEKHEASVKKFGMDARFLQDDRKVAGLIYDLLCTTPIFDKAGRFLIDVSYDFPKLKKFMKLAHELKPTIENLLRFEVRKTEEDAVPQLREILKMVGIGQVRVAKTKAQAVAGGRTVYQYAISTDDLGAVERLVARRKVIRGWDFLNGEYGWLPDIDDS